MVSIVIALLSRLIVFCSFLIAFCYCLIAFFYEAIAFVYYPIALFYYVSLECLCLLVQPIQLVLCCSRIRHIYYIIIVIVDGVLCYTALVHFTVRCAVVYSQPFVFAGPGLQHQLQLPGLSARPGYGPGPG